MKRSTSHASLLFLVSQNFAREKAILPFSSSSLLPSTAASPPPTEPLISDQKTKQNRGLLPSRRSNFCLAVDLFSSLLPTSSSFASTPFPLGYAAPLLLHLSLAFLLKIIPLPPPPSSPTTSLFALELNLFLGALVEEVSSKTTFV